MKALTWKRGFPGRWPGDFGSCETQTMGAKPASIFEIGTGKHKMLPLEKLQAQVQKRRISYSSSVAQRTGLQESGTKPELS
jgi:hypothetical protein